MKFQSVIGRSRTGDQLHRCNWIDYEQEGRKAFISDNASCNNHMHLRPLSAFRSTEKVTVKMRPGLFCLKCFGTDPVNHEYFNAIVVE
jgi:hypothetical protein